MNTTPKPDGGPAFPSVQVKSQSNSDYQVSEAWSENVDGMTLRDYFAAKAMQALMLKFPTVANKGKAEVVTNDDEIAEMRQAIAFSDYKMADAMIAERSK